jgi:hypothetical protein
MSLLLGVCGLGLYSLLATGKLIVSPEYGLVMVQGLPARFALAVLIAANAMAAGLGVHLVRCARSRPSHQALLLVIGALTGLVADLRLRLLNPFDPAPLHVFAYDLWWPPLLIWFCICISEAALTMFAVDDAQERRWWGLWLPLAISLVAVHRYHLGFQYGDSLTPPLWNDCLLICVFALLALGLRGFFKKLGTQAQGSNSWLTVTLPLVLGVAGFYDTLQWIQGGVDHRSLWALWAFWFLLLLVVTVRELYLRGAQVLPQRPSFVRDSLALFALVAFVAGMADILHFGMFEPLWSLTLLIVVIVFLVELLGGFPLRRMAEYELIREIREAEDPLLALGRRARKVLGDLWTRLINRPKETEDTKKSTARLLVKVVLWLLVLSAIAELPNAGKTIVKPFAPLGFAKKEGTNEDTNKDIGRLVSYRIVNTLGLLRQELRSPISTLAPGGDKKVNILDTGEDTSSLEASVTTSDFTIPGTGINIPLSWLTDQIQAPLRGWLGIRVVSGSVQPGADGELLALASTTTGGTWRAPEGIASPPPPVPKQSAVEPAKQGAAKVLAKPDKAKTPAPGKGHANAKPPEKDAARAQLDTSPPKSCSGESTTPEQIVSAEVAELGDEIAYKLVSSDPSLVSAGMTTSWQAIPYFRQGLKRYEAFTAAGDYADLTCAIELFHQAVKIDTRFPWAHYYLGLALRDDGQPGAAVTEFRTSLQYNPGFYRAVRALAQTLYSFDDYYYQLSAELAEVAAGSNDQDKEEARSARIKEARELRQRLILLSTSQMPKTDLAMAYWGLAREKAEKASPLSLPEKYLTYFYAVRAQHIFSHLPAAAISDQEVQTQEISPFQAGNLIALGAVLESTGIVLTTKMGSGPWHCDANTVPNEGVTNDGKITQRTTWRSPYSKAALRLYRRAFYLQPDDPVVRCVFATASYSLDKPQPMKDLEDDARSHLQTAQDFFDKARSHPSPGFLRLALAEYQEAIQLAPDNLTALNGYAYTFWSWRLHGWTKKWPQGPDPFIAHQAEKYARAEVALATAKANPADIAIARSTLAEVLLGQARPEEAAEEFDGLDIDPHAYYNEIRWDMALAYRCKALDERIDHRISPEEYTNLVSKGVDLLNKVASKESGRETQPFTSTGHALESQRPNPVCLWLPKQPGWQATAHGAAVENVPREPLYVLKNDKPRYLSVPPCNWEAIFVSMAGGSLVNDLRLHVWGGGIDRRMPLPASAAADDVFLTNTPRKTHHYYFAQLEDSEDSDETPLSLVYPVETFADTKDSKCSGNMIVLDFEQVAPPVAKARRR